MGRSPAFLLKGTFARGGDHYRVRSRYGAVRRAALRAEYPGPRHLESEDCYGPRGLIREVRTPSGADLWSAMSNHDPSRLTQTRVKRKSSLDGRTRSFIPITLSKLRSRAFHSQLARDNRRIAQHRNAYVVFIVALPTEFADLNERSKRTKVSRYPSGLVAGLMLSRWAKLRRSLEGRLSFSLGST